jgi:haloacetate dehalogenase
MTAHSAATRLFPGFSTLDLPVNGTTIHAVRGGAGPPVLLLHGYPQTHAMWHRVACGSQELSSRLSNALYLRGSTGDGSEECASGTSPCA